MKTILLFILVIVLCGCFGIQREVVPPIPGEPDAGGTPGDALTTIGLWSTYIGGIGLIFCAVAAAFVPNKWGVAKAAMVCVALILGGQIVYWFGQHVALATGLGVGALVLCGIGYAWIHRKAPTRVYTKTDRHI